MMLNAEQHHAPLLCQQLHCPHQLFCLCTCSAFVFAFTWWISDAFVKRTDGIAIMSALAMLLLLLAAAAGV